MRRIFMVATLAALTLPVTLELRGELSAGDSRPLVIGHRGASGLRPEHTLAAYDGLFEVPTLQEVVDLARQMSERTGRRIGIYPETKHPTYFASIGLPLEQRLVDLLHSNGFRGPDAAVFIQSFEVANLQELAGLTDLPLVQLLNDSGRPSTSPPPATPVPTPIWPRPKASAGSPAMPAPSGRTRT